MSTSTAATKPRNHALIQFKKPEENKAPWVPKALRGVTIWQHGIPESEAKTKYGIWTLRALRSCHVKGVHVQADETFEIEGNIAHDLVMFRDAEFVDNGEKAKEAEHERLGRELSARTNFETEPAFKERPQNHYRLQEFNPVNAK